MAITYPYSENIYTISINAIGGTRTSYSNALKLSDLVSQITTTSEQRTYSSASHYISSGVTTTTYNTTALIDNNFKYKGVDSSADKYWYVEGYDNGIPNTLADGTYTIRVYYKSTYTTCSMVLNTTPEVVVPDYEITLSSPSKRVVVTTTYSLGANLSDLLEWVKVKDNTGDTPSTTTYSSSSDPTLDNTFQYKGVDQSSHSYWWIVGENTRPANLAAGSYEIRVCYEGEDYYAVFTLIITENATYEYGYNKHDLYFAVAHNDCYVSGKLVKCYIFDEEDHEIGYIYDMNYKNVNAKVVLYDNYTPATDGSNNLTIKFPCYVAENAKLINDCHFGILFGNNNAKNRLFVSGNSARGNCDWHSGQINTSEDDRGLFPDGNGDFSYFEDTSYCYYGETDNSVVGYDIVSNDKLLVLKDYSDKETTVYFRTPTLVTAIDGAGTSATGIENETLYQEEFALTKGNNSVAGISPKAIANLNGDTLFISKDNQVLGLDLTGIVGDNQRYANTRSYYIDEDLRTRDLSEAWLWTNNKYLLLCHKDKTYLTHFETKGEYQYEWWQMDVADIQTIIEIDDVLYYGDSQGKFYKVNDIWQDIHRIFLSSGSAIFDTSMNGNDLSGSDADTADDCITASSDVINQLDDETTYYFWLRTNHNYYVVGVLGNAESDLYIDSTNNYLVSKELLRDNDTYYVYNNNTYTAYSVEYVSDNNYQLYQNGTLVEDLSGIEGTLVHLLDDKYEIININKTNFTFQLTIDGTNPLDFVGVNTTFTGVIEWYDNVEAFFITAPMLSSINYFKTIWQWTLTNDTNEPSEIELTFTNNKIPYESMSSLTYVSKDASKTKSQLISANALGLDFGTLRFKHIDFDKLLVPRTYTSSRVLDSVKFICFGFRSNSSANSVLSTMSIVYTISHQSYGGD